MKEDVTHFIKLNSWIFRNNQIYLDKALKKYELSSGSFPYLLNLNKREGISQNQIAYDLGHDKAMSARTIAKLIELEYIYKKEDEMDSRAYKLYLTDKAKKIIPDIKIETLKLINLITKGLTEEEKNITINSLSKIFNNISNLRKCKENK